MSRQHAAYQTAQAAVLPPRQIEADIFRRLNFALKKAYDDGNDLALVKAAADVRRYWAFLLGSLTDAHNPLPAQVKDSIIQIARAVIREIDTNIFTSLDVNFIIAINQNLADGLSPQSAPTAPREPVQASA